jgi:hypothetical protein
MMPCVESVVVEAYCCWCLGGKGALIELGDSATDEAGVEGWRKADPTVEGTGDSGMGSMLSWSACRKGDGIRW